MQRSHLFGLSCLCGAVVSAPEVCSAVEFQLVEQVHGDVWDFQLGRVLTHPFRGQVRIRDRATGADTLIYQHAFRDAGYGFLTPRGAIFTASNEISSGVINEWQDGVLLLAEPNPESFLALHARGNYAVWKNGNGVVRRDLVAGTNQIVFGGSALGNGNQVAPNGDVVIHDGRNIHRYRGGVATPLTAAPSGTSYWFPTSDGTNVLFRKSVDSGTATLYGISMVGPGGAEEQLAAPADIGLLGPGPNYQANGGWVAWTERVGTAIVFHRRSPGGVDDPTALPGINSTMITLAPNGGTSMRRGTAEAYIDDPVLGLFSIGPAEVNTFWIDGAWYVVNGGSISEVITTVTPTMWLNPTSGDWTDSANWSTSPQFPHHTPGGPSYDVTIGASAGGGSYAVQSNASVTVMKLAVTAPGARVTFAPATRLTVGSGGVSLAPGTSLTAALASAGDVTVSGATFSGSMHLAAGKKLALTNASVATFAAGTDRLATPQLELSGSSRLTLAPGASRTLYTNAVTLDATSAIDLGDNLAVVDYASSGPSPLNALRALILSGFNGGAWDGNGIRSSVAAANASTHGIGYGQNTSFTLLFGGEMADLTSVLIRYTRRGDATLDGLVNLNDFNALAANFGATNRTWAQGDFDYNGVVNLADFNTLAANFGLRAAGTSVTPGDWAALASAVPEPTSGAAVIGMCSPLLASRRRRAPRGLVGRV